MKKQIKRASMYSASYECLRSLMRFCSEYLIPLCGEGKTTAFDICLRFAILSSPTPGQLAKKMGKLPFHPLQWNKKTWTTEESVVSRYQAEQMLSGITLVLCSIVSDRLRSHPDYKEIWFKAAKDFLKKYDASS
jgi:hypothetical protein